jgi:hypothetical protein
MAPTQELAWPAPATLHHELQQIDADLESATQVSGRLGSTARQLAGRLEAHSLRQDALVLPPLGLLLPLSRGDLSRQMAGMLPLTDRLRHELPRLLDEHMAIARLFDEFTGLAQLARRSDLYHLGRRFGTYALVREQVIYPSALVAGDLLRLHLKREPGR